MILCKFSFIQQDYTFASLNRLSEESSEEPGGVSRAPETSYLMKIHGLFESLSLVLFYLQNLGEMLENWIRDDFWSLEGLR